MKLYLIRHGETLDNKNGIVMGRSNGLLSDIGERQSEQVSSFLIDKNIDLIYSSPLKRCIQTAEIISEKLDVEFVVNELINERDLGIYNGVNIENVSFHDLDIDNAQNMINGVEPLGSIRKRVNDFLNSLEFDNSSNIGVVSHNNPIRMLLSIFLNRDYESIVNDYRIKNCSICEITLNDGGKVTDMKLDITDHLY